MSSPHTAASRLLTRPDPRLVLWALTGYALALGALVFTL